MPKLQFYMLAFAAALAGHVSAHGYLYYPPPRGIEKETYQIDDLKSPNRKGLCRGEPASKTPFSVSPGGSMTLKFKITAPHVGPCAVYVLDANLGNAKKIADKMNCAAPGQGKPWTFKLPEGLSGHKVIRWTWEGRHVSPGEPYEQCIDVSFGGNGSDNAAEPQEETEPEAKKEHKNEPEAKKEHKNKPTGRPMSNKRPKPQSDEQYENADAGSEAPDYNQQQQEMYDADDATDADDQSAPKYNAPDTSDAPDAPDAPSDDGVESESCPTNGAFTCVGTKFAQCANGKWVMFACPTGTACRASDGGSILCLPPTQV